MPEHIVNRVEITGPYETLRKILDKHFAGDGIERCFDFNSVKPMPESLKLPSGSPEMDSVGIYHYINGDGGEDLRKRHQYTWANKLTVDALANAIVARNLCTEPTETRPFVVADINDLAKVGELYIKNKQKYGYPTWREWRRAVWGTTEVASNPIQPKIQSSGPLCFGFDSVESSPKPIFEGLAETYSDCIIVARHFEPITGYGHGDYGMIVARRRRIKEYGWETVLDAALRDGNFNRLVERAIQEMED